MADTRTGQRIEKTSDSSLIAYAFEYLVDIAGETETFRLNVFPSQMADPTDLDEAKAMADGVASAWKTKQTASPDPVVAVEEPAFIGEPTL